MDPADALKMYEEKERRSAALQQYREGIEHYPVAENMLEENNNNDEDATDVPVSTIPPLRPLATAQNPAKRPLTLKSEGNRKVLVLHDSATGKQYKVVASNQNLNESKVTIEKPRTQTISIAQPQKTVTKTVIPKLEPKTFENKDGQLFVLKKPEPQVKIITTRTTTKIMTLSEAQEMGLFSGTSKISTSTTKQNVVTIDQQPIIANKIGHAKTLKTIPKYRPAAQSQSTISALPKTAPQSSFAKQAQRPAEAQIAQSQLKYIPNPSTSRLHQITVPGKGVQYVKLVGIPPMRESIASSSSNTTAPKVTIPSTNNPMKIEKPSSQVAHIRKNQNRIRVCSPSKIMRYPVPPKLPIIDPPPELSNGIRGRKSQCFQLNRECFANGDIRANSYNNVENELNRQRAIKNYRERNPDAFQAKIGNEMGAFQRNYTKGCKCKTSACFKNYCECYKTKTACTIHCRCKGCKNVVPSAEAVPSTSFASMSTACGPSCKISVERINSEESETLITDLFNSKVITTTTKCLLEVAKEGKRQGKDKEKIQDDLIIQFGQCLQGIIQCSSGRNVESK